MYEADAVTQSHVDWCLNVLVRLDPWAWRALQEELDLDDSAEDRKRDARLVDTLSALEKVTVNRGLRRLRRNIGRFNQIYVDNKLHRDAGYLARTFRTPITVAFTLATVACGLGLGHALENGRVDQVSWWIIGLVIAGLLSGLALTSRLMIWLATRVSRPLGWSWISWRYIAAERYILAPGAKDSALLERAGQIVHAVRTRLAWHRS